MNHRYWLLAGIVGLTFFVVPLVSADTSELHVYTKPSSLPVFLNESLVDSSPVTFSSRDVWRQVTLSEGDTLPKIYMRPEGSARITMNAGKARSDSTFKIKVKSDPPEARIQVNGRNKGKTPWSARVDPDTLALDLEKEGFLPWSMKIFPRGQISLVSILDRKARVDTEVISTRDGGVEEVSSHEDLDSEGILRRVIPPPTKSDAGTLEDAETPQPQGTIPLEIESSPSGALVTVNGRELGRTPLIGEKFPRGSVTVRLKKSGYRLWKERIDLIQPTLIKVKLRKE